MQTPGRRQAFGAELKAARERAGLTQAQAVAKMREAGDELTPAAWSGYETGTYAPTVDRVRIMEQVLGCPDDLVRILGMPNPSDFMERLAKLERDMAAQRAVEAEILEIVRAIAAGLGPR